jgi:hypothetical protein
MVNSDAAKLTSWISKTFALSNIAKLTYKAIDDGSVLREAQTLNSDPLKYRNEAFYIDFDGNWKPPRYPGDELCAAQIKLVKGAAKSYLYFINTHGLLWLVSHPEYFGS